MIYNKKSIIIALWVSLCIPFLWVQASSYTPAEQQQVENEVLKLQNHILQTSTHWYDEVIQKYKTLSSYEEKGNLTLDMEVNESANQNLKLNLSFDHYDAKASGMDSEFHSNMSMKVQSTDFDETVDVSLDTFLSLISKDGDIYALLKDISLQSNDELALEDLQFIKDLFEDGKYLKIPSDPMTQQFMQFLSQNWLSGLFSEYQTALSKPLFTAYKKIWDTFELIPSQAFCENYFKFTSFWYLSDDCTSGNYALLVKNFLSKGKLVLSTQWKVTTLTYSSIKSEEKINLSLSYNDSEILWVNLTITPDQKKYPKEWLEFKYISNNSLWLLLVGNSGKTKITFDWILDKSNNFTQAVWSVKSENFLANLTLKNHKISGSWILKQKGYQYNPKTSKYDEKLQNIFAGRVSWTTKTDHSLSTLKFLLGGLDAQTKKVFLQWMFDYNRWNISHNLLVESEFFDLVSWGKWFISSGVFNYDASFEAMGYDGRVDISYDTTNNKNNLDFNLELYQESNALFDMKLKNEAQRVYKTDIEIIAPTDFNEYDPYAMYDLDDYEDYDWDDEDWEYYEY